MKNIKLLLCLFFRKNIFRIILLVFLFFMLLLCNVLNKIIGVFCYEKCVQPAGCQTENISLSLHHASPKILSL